MVYQELTRITKSIQDGDFFENPDFVDAMRRSAKKNGGKLHLMGLLSDGGVHSHITHLLCADWIWPSSSGLDNVYVHCFMDGRDVPPSSGIEYVAAARRKAAWTMVRAARSPPIMRPLLRHGPRQALGPRPEGLRRHRAAAMATRRIARSAAMKNSYKNAEVTDEFVVPCVIQEDGKPVASVEAGDCDDLLQLPPRPRPRDHPRLRRRGLQRFRAPGRL